MRNADGSGVELERMIASMNMERANGNHDIQQNGVNTVSQYTEATSYSARPNGEVQSQGITNQSQYTNDSTEITDLLARMKVFSQVLVHT